MSRTKFFALTAILLGVVAVSVWQWQAVRALKNENARLKNLAEQVDKLGEENARLQRTQADPGELERLRREQSELLKLRNVVSQLRKQLKEADARRTASVVNTNSATAEQADASPVANVLGRCQGYCSTKTNANHRRLVDRTWQAYIRACNP